MTALSSAGFAAATSGAEAPRRGVLRGAIIGLGNVALHGHLPGWLSRREVEIVAVTDTDPARRAARAARLPAGRRDDTARPLLAAARPDLLAICPPPAGH